MKRWRIYADTSVFGGCFDARFAQDSLRLFEEIRAGRFVLVVSAVTLLELHPAPQAVQGLLQDLPAGSLEHMAPSDEIDRLRDAYLEAAVVGPGSRRDAEHIAAASVADVDVVVSWNFRHIVHFDRIRGYHAVNLMQGYRLVPIHTPREVIQW